MTLRHLNNITVTNGLSNSIDDLSIVYAESVNYSYWRSNKVNVERSENILWTRTVHIGPVEANSSSSVSAESIYFGENYGFWQLYTTYQGGQYKLASQDCRLSLSQTCHEKDLIICIQLDAHSKITVKFQIDGKEKEFEIINEVPLVKGVSVLVKNCLDGDIKNFNLSFSQESESNKSQESFGNFTTTIPFDSWNIKNNECIKSVDRVNFTSCDEPHIWKLHFVHENFCYELDFVNDTKMNLTPLDHDTILEVVIFLDQKKNHIKLTLKFSNREVYKIIERTCSLEEKTENIKKMADDLNRFMKINFQSHLKGFADLLTRLSIELRKTDSDISDKHSSNNSQNEKADDKLETLEIENVKLSVTALFTAESNLKIKDILKAVVKDLINLKNLWKELRDKACKLQNVLTDIIDINYLDQIDQDENLDSELKLIFTDLMRLDLLVAVNSLCHVLEISGCNNVGLIFCIPNCESEKTFKFKPDLLASALNEEYEICQQMCFNLDEGITASDDTIINQQVLENSFKKCLELLIIVRNELVRRLFKTASELHLKKRNVNITMITSSATAVAGAGMAITGILAAPFTAGVSLGLTATGIGMTVAGGATGIITGIVDSALTSKFLNSTVDLVRSDQSLSNSLSTLQLLLSKELKHDLSEDNKSKHALDQSASLKGNVTHMVGNVGVRAAKIGAHLSGYVALRIIGIAPGLVFDLTSLIFNSISLASGGRSKIGYKLEMQAIQLQESLNQLNLLLKS